MWYNKNTRTRVATWPSQHFFVLALWNGRVIVQARTTAAVLSYTVYYIVLQKVSKFVIACSHRRHYQDKTVYSLVRVDGVNKL